MKKLLMMMLVFSFAATAEEKINVVGVWKITALNQNQPFAVVSSIGYDLVLRFNEDSTVDKFITSSSSFVPISYNWKVNPDGKIHLKNNDGNGNFISSFVLRTHRNDYIEAEEALGDNCYKVLINGSGQQNRPAKMCKIQH